MSIENMYGQPLNMSQDFKTQRDPEKQAMTDLKIEAGKCYETRDGRKAHVVFIREDEAGQSIPVIGYMENQGGHSSWLLDGRYAYSEIKGWSTADLISEWKEPRKAEVWVNCWFYDDGNVGVSLPFQTKKDADRKPGDRDRDACVKLTITEGQGLDGEGQEAEKLEKAWRGAAAKVFLNSPGGELQSGEGSE